MFVACRNPECMSFGGLVKTPLERKWVTINNKTLKCSKCKSVWDIKIRPMKEGDKCPKCKGILKKPRTWHYYCPKCGQEY